VESFLFKLQRSVHGRVRALHSYWGGCPPSLPHREERPGESVPTVAIFLPQLVLLFGSACRVSKPVCLVSLCWNPHRAHPRHPLIVGGLTSRTVSIRTRAAMLRQGHPSAVQGGRELHPRLRQQGEQQAPPTGEERRAGHSLNRHRYPCKSTSCA